MGMYTEILIKADVDENAPQEIRWVLEYLFNNVRLPLDFEMPEHEFFSEDHRWRAIGTCNSYYHIPWTNSRYMENRIFSRSDLKNYNNEVELFFDWIDPYLDESSGQCIGYKWYEEDTEPTLVYKQ